MNEEERMIKEQITVRELKEGQLLRDLRGVRGEIEQLKRNLEIKQNLRKIGSQKNDIQCNRSY